MTTIGYAIGAVVGLGLLGLAVLTAGVIVGPFGSFGVLGAWALGQGRRHA